MSTKTIILFLSIIILIVNASFAQDWKNRSEITLGYGTISHEFLNAKNRNLEHIMGIGSTDKTRDCRTVGIVLLSYRYFINNHLSIGLGLGYEHFKGVTKNLYNWQRTDFRLVPEVNYIYKTSSRIKLYGMAATGVSYKTDKVNQTIYSYGTLHNGTSTRLDMAFHVSPIGIRFGNKFGGYAEAGYGYKGVINLGFSLKI